ncbi:MAG: AI-2E family transporter [Pseudomonadales bacterium]|nr:AI-2E family transporter [Pseudomonadales bacterium]
MNTNGKSVEVSNSQVIDLAIRIGLIAVLVYFCLNIVSPFLSIILWGGTIAIAFYSPFQGMEAKLGSRKTAVIVFILGGLVLVLVPAYLFSGSLVDSARDLGRGVMDGTLVIDPPRESVRDWPLIGERAYETWSEVSTDATQFIRDNRDMFTTTGRMLLGTAAGIEVSILQFSLSIIVAGLFLSSPESAKSSFSMISRRITGERGDELIDLSTATIRSVAVGVLGIAFIQALLSGIGMIAVGVPGAGLWALLILILAVAQLPPWIILLPAAAYVFSVESTTVSIVFLIYSLIVSFLDMALKPLFLGRGVDAPMPVILIGAIGGMIYGGIIGLFLGAVLLALGYKLLVAWAQYSETTTSAE